MEKYGGWLNSTVTFSFTSMSVLDFPSFSGMNHIFKDISDISLLNVHMNLIDDFRLFNKVKKTIYIVI